MDLPIDMQHQAMGYDRTATMFSPEGTIIQVEYAEKATKWGSSSIGMVCSDGVLIVADKRIDDKLIVPKSANKIYEIDSHVIASAAGVVSDARVLVERAQVLAQQHRVTYDSAIEPELVIKEIANIKQQFTQYGGARPFGVFFMLAGMNGKKPELYVSNVSGNYFSYFANAIGENDEKIKEKLREGYKHDLTVKKGAKLALDIFKEVQGAKFNSEKFEAVYITNDGKIMRVDEGEIKNFAK
ncbi:archaeal proteasome endopeptidase complex subunit alpha [Candidatus Pacearchaeota archaeon]|nr:archaeal proteasome endopeptidase complex subunit alpha [Candidatus Pacearchaeota archaeon]